MEFRATVVENRALGRGSFVLRLGGCAALSSARPGQFVMVRGEWGRDPLLPRAFSILRTRGDECEILVKAVGRGTRLLEHAAEGDRLILLGPLGRAFPFPASDEVWPHHVLVAGGVGLAPLLWFAEQAQPRNLTLLYGARTADDLVLLDEIHACRVTLGLTTEDGSSPPGRPPASRGRVTDALARLLPSRLTSEAPPLPPPRPRVLTCGPNAMMRAVAELAHARGLDCFVSVEGEMACGIGACLGCAVPSVAGAARPFRYACVDGPVFDAHEIVIP